MGIIYFTISLDPDTNTIDATNLPEGLKQAYMDVFSILTLNPASLNESVAVFDKYYTDKHLLEIKNANKLDNDKINRE